MKLGKSDNLFGVVGEGLLELASVADEHLTGRRLLLQAGRFDAKVLLVVQRHKLPIVITLSRFQTKRQNQRQQAFLFLFQCEAITT